MSKFLESARKFCCYSKLNFVVYFVNCTKMLFLLIFRYNGAKTTWICRVKAGVHQAYL